MTEVALVLIGWFLGLLTPQIVDRISRRYRRPELMNSIALELDELRFKLLMVVYDVRWAQGRLDRQFAEWAAVRARRYSGAISDHPSRSHVIEFGSYTDPQLAALNAMPEDPRRVRSPKRYSVPFLAANLDAVTILSFDIQRRLFELLARLDFYNAAVDTLAANLNLTFTPGLSSENWQVIQANNRQALASLDASAMQIIGHIDSLMPMLSSQSNNALQRTDSPVTPLAGKTQASRQAAGR